MRHAREQRSFPGTVPETVTCVASCDARAARSCRVTVVSPTPGEAGSRPRPVRAGHHLTKALAEARLRALAPPKPGRVCARLARAFVRVRWVAGDRRLRRSLFLLGGH